MRNISSTSPPAARLGAARRLALLALATGLLILAACARGVDPVLKIGLVAPFEGELRFIGYDVIYSARLAVRQINTAGGVGGYRLALVAYDDSSYPQQAADVAQALIIDPGVVAVLGHWHPDTTAVAAPLYREAGLAFLPMGDGPFGPSDPAALDDSFRAAYTAVTFQGAQPPGPYAGATYDAMQLIAAAVERAADRSRRVTRTAVFEALPTVQITGLTGVKALP